jgi:uncharacterized protein (UPF0254 family)
MSSKLTKTDVEYLLHHDETFVNSKRFGYSIDAVMERYPEGAPDNVICQLLDLDQGSLDALYEDVVQTLRSIMKVEPEEPDAKLRYSTLPPEEP